MHLLSQFWSWDCFIYSSLKIMVFQIGWNVYQEIVVPSGLMELSPSVFLEFLDFYFDKMNWEEEAINMMVSLNATNANSEKKWLGFYHSLSQSELKDEWDEYWKSWLMLPPYWFDVPLTPNHWIEVRSKFRAHFHNQVFLYSSIWLALLHLCSTKVEWILGVPQLLILDLL